MGGDPVCIVGYAIKSIDFLANSSNTIAGDAFLDSLIWVSIIMYVLWCPRVSLSRASVAQLGPRALSPYQPTILFLHQHINPIMSTIEDPKQLSLRTKELSNNALGINAPPSPAHKSAPADSSVHYTCFIRLPFSRGDFVDPPQVVLYMSETLVWTVSDSEIGWLEFDQRSCAMENHLQGFKQQRAGLYVIDSVFVEYNTIANN